MNVVTIPTVAPLVGAWIEIFVYVFSPYLYKVAPLVGAWIEIYASFGLYASSLVAPLVGAWIEIITFTNGYST